MMFIYVGRNPCSHILRRFGMGRMTGRYSCALWLGARIRASSLSHALDRWVVDRGLHNPDVKQRCEFLDAFAESAIDYETHPMLDSWHVWYPYSGSSSG